MGLWLPSRCYMRFAFFYVVRPLCSYFLVTVLLQLPYPLTHVLCLEYHISSCTRSLSHSLRGQLLFSQAIVDLRTGTTAALEMNAVRIIQRPCIVSLLTSDIGSQYGWVRRYPKSSSRLCFRPINLRSRLTWLSVRHYRQPLRCSILPVPLLRILLALREAQPK